MKIIKMRWRENLVRENEWNCKWDGWI